MNNSFANATNATQVSPGNPPIDYFILTVSVFYLTPLLLFNILLTVIIAMEKSIVAALRLVLVNIVAAGQVVIAGTIVGAIATVII